MPGGFPGFSPSGDGEKPGKTPPRPRGKTLHRRRRVFPHRPGVPPGKNPENLPGVGENPENLIGRGEKPGKPRAGGFFWVFPGFPLPKREKPSAEEENPANLPPGRDNAIRVRIVCPVCGMFSPRRHARADRWPRARNVPPTPQYACGSLAARAECSPRAAIRVQVVGRARGMFSPRRNTRADRWLRARNVLPVPQYASGSLGARAECSPRAAIHLRIVGRARGMFSPRRKTRADRWPRARNVLPAPQYACGSLAARAECSPRARA